MNAADRERVVELARQVFPAMDPSPQVSYYHHPTNRVVIPVIGEPFIFIKVERFRLPDGREVGLGYSPRGKVLAVDCSRLDDFER